MSTSDRGKWAEKQARDWLEARSANSFKFSFHRYPDSKAARGALAAQPSDYVTSDMTSGTPKIRHIEVKETAVENRLPKTKVRQYGMLLKFHWAGIAAFVVVYRSAHNNWIVLGAHELFAYEVCPPSFDMRELTTYPTCAAAMRSIFE